MEINKQQVIEDYFRAYQKHNDFGLGDVMLGGIPPNIIDHYPSFKKWVLEKMEEKGYRLNVFNGRAVHWGSDYTPLLIEDGEITLAAVKAATRYWREKNADK